MSTKMTKALLTALVVMTLASIPGCIENGKSLVIVASVIPEMSTSTGGSTACTVNVQSEDKFDYLPSGLLDLNFPGFSGQPHYNLYVQIHNYILSSANADNLTNNANDVQLVRFEVRYKWLSGRELLEDTVNFPAGQGLLFIEDQKVVSPTSGIIPAAGDIGDPGKTTSKVVAIPKDLIGSNLVNIGEEYVDSLVLGARVKVIGKTLGGSRIESNEFTFPIYFCWGCQACLDGTYVACDDGQDLFSCKPD